MPYRFTGTKKHHPILDRHNHSHAMTIRINADYNAYLENIAYLTRLDKSQLIRLLIHLAPYNAKFNELVERRIANDKRGIIFVVDWEDDFDTWLWE